MKKNTGLVYGCLLAAGALLGCAGDTETWATEAEVIEMIRGPGLGFCLDDGFTNVKIERQESGEFLLSGALARRDVPENAEQCLDTDRIDAYEDGERCLYDEEICPRTIPASELEFILDTLQDFPKKRCKDRSDNMVGDPCLRTKIVVDGIERDSFCTGDLNDAFEEAFDGLASDIDELALAGRAEDSCDADTN